MGINPENIFLVGGAVRDRLVEQHHGIPQGVSDNDFVVIQHSRQDMLDADFHSVGKSFPVFLHPDTSEEYALARRFENGELVFTIDNTLERDLACRDLTINAIAQDHQDHLIDPFNGTADIQQKTLRHLPHAFDRDPIRVLRLARFTAQLPDFSIADETLSEVKQLPLPDWQSIQAERVWLELKKALLSAKPSRFFETLDQLGWLDFCFPELATLKGVPQTAKYHPEVDTFVHTMLTVDMAAQLSDALDVRFAALLHDLGKGATPPEKWPKHHGHEAAGIPLVKQFCRRVNAPEQLTKLAKLTSEYHLHCHRISELRNVKLVDLLKALGHFGHNSLLEPFLIACEADSRGRTGFENKAYPQANYLRQAGKIAANIQGRDLIAQGVQAGPNLAKDLRRARTAAIAQLPKPE